MTSLGRSHRPDPRKGNSGRMCSTAEGLVHHDPVARRPGASARRYVGQPAKDYSPSPQSLPALPRSPRKKEGNPAARPPPAYGPTVNAALASRCRSAGLLPALIGRMQSLRCQGDPVRHQNTVGAETAGPIRLFGASTRLSDWFYLRVQSFRRCVPATGPGRRWPGRPRSVVLQGAGGCFRRYGLDTTVALTTMAGLVTLRCPGFARARIMLS